MSVAFFGIVRNRPKIETRSIATERRVADFNEMWSRRLERLSELVEGCSGGYACAEGLR